MAIKLVIIEDEKKVLESLNILLNGFPTIEIVGTYTSGDEAIENISNIMPDVALVDLQLKNSKRSGFDIISEIKKNYPRTHVLVFTQFDDDKHLFPALKAGAVGYLLKESCPTEIIEAIEDVFKGGGPMSRSISRRILEDFHESPQKNTNEFSLTFQEEKILEEIAKGYSNKDIAKKLFISYETVRTHLKHIYEKLHVHSRHGAINKIKRLF